MPSFSLLGAGKNIFNKFLLTNVNLMTFCTGMQLCKCINLKLTVVGYEGRKLCLKASYFGAQKK